MPTATSSMRSTREAELLLALLEGGDGSAEDLQPLRQVLRPVSVQGLQALLELPCASAWGIHLHFEVS